MNEFEIDMMKGMISILNEASYRYYNGKEPIMTDEQFDMRLKDLQQLEEETGIILSNSPTINVGSKILDNFVEVTHNHPMLSLNKCHSPEEIIKFANNKDMIASIKLDGMTISLLYEDGILMRGETRGNGHVGSDVTEHVKRFLNVPLKINKMGTYIIDGEAIIKDEDFLEINKENCFKNSRNLTSGTLSSLDTSLVSKRKLRFLAWDVISSNNNSLDENLKEAQEIGFDVVPHWFINSNTQLKCKNIENSLSYMFEYAIDEGLPCDGIVFKFNDIEYGKSLGATSHHLKNGIAYKSENTMCKTKLIDIEFSMGKTGILTPTAIFKPVEIDGTTVERASLSNLSVIEDTLGVPYVGQEIIVSKRNAIIPKVESGHLDLYPTNKINIPEFCPICGERTKIKQDNDSKILICTNESCKGKLLGKLTHFVSKNAMNIEGLSEATLEKFINLGFIENYIDIYKLKNRFENDILALSGFGKKSTDKMFDAIEKSKITTLDKFIYALGIPLIGKSISKDIAKYCKYDFSILFHTLSSNKKYNLDEIDGLGYKMVESIEDWWLNNDESVFDLAKYITFMKPLKKNDSDILKDKTFVITGSLNHFENRNKLKEEIESLGGKVANSITNKTNYLICNDTSSKSSKYKKAKELGVSIINENDFLEMAK